MCPIECILAYGLFKLATKEAASDDSHLQPR